MKLTNQSPSIIEVTTQARTYFDMTFHCFLDLMTTVLILHIPPAKWRTRFLRWESTCQNIFILSFS